MKKKHALLGFSIGVVAYLAYKGFLPHIGSWIKEKLKHESEEDRQIRLTKPLSSLGADLGLPDLDSDDAGF